MNPRLVKAHNKSLRAYFSDGFVNPQETMKLRSVLDLLVRHHDRKFVIFCHHIAVAKSLDQYLMKNDIQSYYLEGDVTRSDKKFIDFNDEKGKTRVLVVTDEHSQGVSLHESKAWLIHFELSWNPIRIIQRYGRVWRINRKSRKLTTPLAFYVPHSHSSEEEMLSRLQRRWKVLRDVSKKPESNFVNLAPMSFDVALGIRCSPPVNE